MQFLSFIPRYFARRKANADLREQCDEARRRDSDAATLLSGMRKEQLSEFLLPGEAILERKEYEKLRHIGEAILADLRGTGEQSKVATQTMIECIQDVRATLKNWNGNGLPATREEFDALCPSAAALKNAERAQKSAEGARTAAGLPCEGKDFSTDAPVFDEDHDLQIMGILGVNVKAGWILVAELPVALTEHGHIKSRRLRFSSIIEFKPNDQGSGSFHCYGRISE